MEFLSIDLEACNRYVKGSVFSIGVVCADESFNVLYKKDIIINPHCKFCTNFRKPIEFSVKKEDVLDAPSLSDIYDELKELFSGDKVIMAHSANNDMFMLNEACKRAKLPPLEFRYICTQMIYSAVFDVMNGIGLDKAVEDLHIDFKHHKADDDAEMALWVLKSCLDYVGVSYKELEKKLGIKRGSIRNYTFTPMRCIALEKLRQKHREENKALQLAIEKELSHGDFTKVEVEPRNFDLLRQGHKAYIYTHLDESFDNLQIDSVIFARRNSTHGGLIKAKVLNISHFSDLLELYNAEKEKVASHNEAELDFLLRAYEVVDEMKEHENGILLLEVQNEEVA